jgi:hypothetical protein
MYRGKPTRFWRTELDDWCTAQDWGCIQCEERPRSWLETTVWKHFGVGHAPGGAIASQLWEGDPEAIPVLIELLRDPDGGIRAQAAYALGCIGPKAKDAVLPLMEALNDTDSILVREKSATALGAIGREARQAIPLLLASIKDEENHIDARQSAHSAVAQIDPEIASSIPAPERKSSP